MRLFKAIKWRQAKFGETWYGYVNSALFFSCCPYEKRWLLRIYLPGFKEAEVGTKREAWNLAKQVLERFIERFTRKQIPKNTKITRCPKCRKKIKIKG